MIIKEKLFDKVHMPYFSVIADINECALYPGICPYPSRCRNTVGGHTCDCPKGFVSDRQKICVGKLFVFQLTFWLLVKLSQRIVVFPNVTNSNPKFGIALERLTVSKSKLFSKQLLSSHKVENERIPLLWDCLLSPAACGRFGINVSKRLMVWGRVNI